MLCSLRRLSRGRRAGDMSAAYAEAVEYLERIPRFAAKSSPEVTRAWLKILGDPERGMKILHVAGTNGKGSVCCYLAHILREAGYSVGLFTSPHLVCIRERMEVDGQLITEKEFASEFAKVSGVIQEHTELPHPAFFEFLFLMSMEFFRSKGPDFVILETGLGGRLDATNTVGTKELTVITRIGMDHMQYLGDTLSEIAAEKAGILRSGIPAVYLEDPAEAFGTILQKAVSIGAPSYTIGSDTYGVTEILRDGTDFFCHTGRGEIFHARLRTPAVYQAENAALAVRAAEVLNNVIHERGGREITRAEIVRGLESSCWPGRMEEVLPRVWLDGAHNTDGFRAFLESVQRGAGEIPEGGRRILLFSAVRDKQYREELQMVEQSGLFTDIVAVPMHGARALTLTELEEAVQESVQLRRQELYRNSPGLLFHLAGEKAAGDISVHEVSGAGEAVEKYIAAKRPEDEVYAAGSLYLTGELLALLKRSDTAL